MPLCKSCGARVLWVRVGDRPMPLDPDPSPSGNVVVDWRNALGFVLGAEALAAAMLATDPDPAPRYVSHFATCPDADDWRRRR